MQIIHREKLNLLKNVKAILFDWDGVFHSGYKNLHGESQFSEADSMGLNLLRLGYYLSTGNIPFTAIITGEQNPTAHYLVEREHLNGIFYKVKDKKIILDYLKSEHNILPNEVIFVFDDVLDLSLAKECGIRFLVNRKASLSLHQFIKKNELTDFISDLNGNEHAVREICEFLLYEMDELYSTLKCRIGFGDDYQEYWNKRQSIVPKKMTIQDFRLVSE